MSMFGLLEGLSPWWWVAFALALGALEMLSMSFFLIGPGLAALVMAAVLALFPDIPGTIQIAVFAVLSIVLTYLMKFLRTKSPTSDSASGLNSRANRLVGAQARVIQFERGEGAVEVEGVRWKAKADPNTQGLTEGTTVEIAAADGMVLTIRSTEFD